MFIKAGRPRNSILLLINSVHTEEVLKVRFRLLSKKNCVCVVHQSAYLRHTKNDNTYHIKGYPLLYWTREQKASRCFTAQCKVHWPYPSIALPLPIWSSKTLATPFCSLCEVADFHVHLQCGDWLKSSTFRLLLWKQCRELEVTLPAPSQGILNHLS